MPEKQKPGRTFKLEIPLDASQIADFKPEQELKVLIQKSDGSHLSQTVQLNAKGQGTASFTFTEQPGSVQVVVGPGAASDEELLGMQTINFTLSSRQWQEKTGLSLPPVLISAYYWYWWLRWCRTFTIRGRVVCPDGSLRLHIPDLRNAFPETCCYQLELRAYKRTIVSCYDGAGHNNLSEYSLTVII